jgi:hypothetical protein
VLHSSEGGILLAAAAMAATADDGVGEHARGGKDGDLLLDGCSCLHRDGQTAQWGTSTAGASGCSRHSVSVRALGAWPSLGARRLGPGGRVVTACVEGGTHREGATWSPGGFSVRALGEGPRCAAALERRSAAPTLEAPFYSMWTVLTNFFSKYLNWVTKFLIPNL